MNRRQAFVLLAAGIAIALLALFPPYYGGYISDGLVINLTSKGHSFIMSPPVLNDDAQFVSIDYHRLLTYIGGTCALAFGLYHSLRDFERQ